MSVRLLNLQVLYGLAGARGKFEELIRDLVHKEESGGRQIRLDPGDGGIDVYVGDFNDPNGIDVYQVKYFPNEIGDSQKAQIRNSFWKCSTDTRFKVKSWTLCIPLDMSVAETQWFDDWKEKQSTETGVLMQKPWTASKIESLLHQEKNRDIREAYFQEHHLTQIRETHAAVKEIHEKMVGRPSNQVLIPHFLREECYKCIRHKERVVLAIRIHLEIENPATDHSVPNWQVAWRMDWPVGIPQPYVTKREFPSLGTGRTQIELDRTIMPTLSKNDFVHLGIPILPSSPIHSQIVSALLQCRLFVKGITENHVPEETMFVLQDILDFNALALEAEASLKELRRSEAPKQVTFPNEMPVSLDREFGFHAYADGKTLKCRITYKALVQWFFLRERDLRTLRGAFETYRSEIESFTRTKITNGEAEDGLVITSEMVFQEVQGGKGHRLAT